MYQDGLGSILEGTRGTWEARDEHENDRHDEGSGPMIRIGSVGETTYDARAEATPPVLPRPRSSVETGSATRPPAA
jgi:hypothetical protein